MRGSRLACAPVCACVCVCVCVKTDVCTLTLKYTHSYTNTHHTHTVVYGGTSRVDESQQAAVCVCVCVNSWPFSGLSLTCERMSFWRGSDRTDQHSIP